MLIVATLLAINSANIFAQEIITVVSEESGKFLKTVEKKWKKTQSLQPRTQVTHLSISGNLGIVDIPYISTLFPNLEYLDLDQVILTSKMQANVKLNLTKLKEVRLPVSCSELRGEMPSLQRVVLYNLGGGNFPCISERNFVPQVYLKKEGQTVDVDFSNPFPMNSAIFTKCDADNYKSGYAYYSTIGLLIISPEGSNLSTKYQNVTYLPQNNIIILNNWRSHYTLDILERVDAISYLQSGLKNVKFPHITFSSKLKNLIDYAFNENKYVKKVTLPDGFRSFGKNAFWKSTIAEIEIPSTVSDIPNWCFAECRNLKSITLTEGLNSIGERAFQSSSIESVTLPSTLNSLYANAFRDCRSLSKCELLSITPPKIVKSSSGNSINNYDVEEWKKIWANCIVEVPDGCYEKYANAEFWKYITIIEKGNKRSGLSYDLTLKEPGTLLSHIPLDSLHKIDSITIKGILYESDLIILKQCTRLSYLDISKTYVIESPQSIQARKDSQKIIGGIVGLLGIAADINLNNGGLTAGEYMTNAVISELSKRPSQVVNTDNKCYIPYQAFSDMKLLKYVKLPYRAKSIGKEAFSSCVSLETIELPLLLEYIGEKAFAGCSKLQEMTFPKTLKKMKYYIFAGCDSMQKVDLSRCSFEDDFSLYILDGFTGEVNLPRGIESVSYDSVSGLTNKISSYHFPASLVTIHGVGFNTGTKLYFANPIPPAQTSSRIVANSCTFYIPKGSLTSYYSSFGASNKYIEQ